MASKRKYAYYLRGNQIAIIEEGLGAGVCSLSGYSNQTTCEAAGGTWTENATGTDDGLYRSPTASVTDGLEIEYAYSPRYFINETDKVDTQIDTYVSTDGLLKLIDQGDNDYSASPESLSDGSYIVLKKAGKWNGLHKVKAAGTGYITLYTKCSDSSTVQQTFEETIDLYYNVDVLGDESDTIDLPEYLAKALVYYVKAKMAEDQGDMERMQYNEVQFRALMNRYENSRIWGSRRVAPGIGAIR
jgi:hypothetical protein